MARASSTDPHERPQASETANELFADFILPRGGNHCDRYEVGISYLADSIIFLRYLEMQGEIGKAIGVLKKRLTNFEKTLREFEVSRYGIKVGRPLTGVRGILTGNVEWGDSAAKE